MSQYWLTLPTGGQSASAQQLPVEPELPLVPELEVPELDVPELEPT
jgi:hypothetical protein